MAAPAPVDVAHAARPGGRWLYGPAPDLLLGAGVGYVASIPLLVAFSGVWEVAAWPALAIALMALFLSGPHYGATILRVYEQRDDRRKYVLFSVWATIALGALFVAGLRYGLVGSLLFTAYATWSPWHFSGQNYGLALMFLRRRGVVVEPRAKRLLYVSFLLSFALWILVLHGQGYVAAIASVPFPGDLEQQAIRFLPLRIPAALLALAIPVVGLAYLLSLGGAVALLLRDANVRDLAPSICLLGVQALWYSAPAFLRVVASIPLEGLAFSVIWISAAHAVQYLWVTSYYAKREDPSHRLGPYLGRALLAGSAVTILPGLAFAPYLLGSVPWDLGLAILVVSVVNLHHFVLDGAIWKLRDGRIARLLLRDASPESGGAPALAPSGSRFRAAVAMLGLAALSIAGADLWMRSVVSRHEHRDVDELVRASRWLSWIGRDGPQLHFGVGRMLERAGRPEEALAAFRRSLDLHPTPAAWVGLGHAQATLGLWDDASEAFAAALSQSPDHVGALVGSAQTWMRLGRLDLAREALTRASALDPENAKIRELLARANAAASEAS